MYKVGDEVYVKGTIKEIVKGVMYPFHVEFAEMEHGHFLREELYKADKTYEQGLTDAWELAKKIRVQPIDGGIPLNELEEIFGTTFMDTIFKNNTYEEALAKIETYEKEKEIKVGDVVEDEEGTKALVIDESTENTCFVFTENGCVEDWYKVDLKKTDKKISIGELLRQIGE